MNKTARTVLIQPIAALIAAVLAVISIVVIVLITPQKGAGLVVVTT